MNRIKIVTIIIVIMLHMTTALKALEPYPLFDRLIPKPQVIETGKADIEIKVPGRALVIMAQAERQSPTVPKLVNYLHSLGLDPVDMATEIHTDDNYNLVLILGPVKGNPMADPYASLFPGLDSSLEDALNPGEAYVLALRSAGDMPVVWLGGRTPAGTFYAFQTLMQLLRPGPAPYALPELTIKDWPDFTFRGILEGGMTAWDHPYRVHIMEIMGAMKFNIYLYAPKGDWKTRRRWRDPYTSREVEHLKEVFTTARNNFVSVGYTLNLALSIHFSDPEDFNRIMARFKQMFDIGATDFGLFFDDSLPNLTNDADRKAYGRVGIAQSDLANRVFAAVRQWDPNIRFFFTPSLYWSYQDVQYLRDLREHLDPEISVGWTGVDIASDDITDQDAQKIEAVLGRKVGIGDNFWTNGFTPVMRRSLTLYKYVTGYITNSEWVSRLCMDTTGDYTWNPEAYDPEHSYKNAITNVSGEVRYPHLRAFLDSFEDIRGELDPTTIKGPVPDAMNDVLIASGDGIPVALAALWDETNRMLEALELFNAEVIHGDMHMIDQGGKPFAKARDHFTEFRAQVEQLIDDLSSGARPEDILSRSWELKSKYFK